MRAQNPLDPASAKTQIAGTVGTYRKAATLIRGKVLDYGAGLGLGADELRQQGLSVRTFEPFPQRWKSKTKPDFRASHEIPSNDFDAVVCLNVLNVVGLEDRDMLLREFARVLVPGGLAIVVVRSVGNVKVAKVKIPGPEPGSWFVGHGSDVRYQKGFVQAELQEYVRSKGWKNIRPGALGNVSVVMTAPVR